MSADGSEIVPIWDGLLTGDPLPVDGKVAPPDLPGWGIELNRARVTPVSTITESSRA
jgi:L-alanine-DL-glutamate epimerase-like enolase superfamily enzyme